MADTDTDTNTSIIDKIKQDFDVIKLFLTKFLTKDIVEAIIKKFQHGDDNPAGEKFGQFFDVLRNIMVETLESSQLGIKIETKLSELICPGLSKIGSKMDKLGADMKTKALKGATQVKKLTT